MKESTAALQTVNTVRLFHTLFALAIYLTIFSPTCLQLEYSTDNLNSFLCHIMRQQYYATCIACQAAILCPLLLLVCGSCVAQEQASSNPRLFYLTAKIVVPFELAICWLFTILIDVKVSRLGTGVPSVYADCRVYGDAGSGVEGGCRFAGSASFGSFHESKLVPLFLSLFEATVAAVVAYRYRKESREGQIKLEEKEVGRSCI